MVLLSALAILVFGRVGMLHGKQFTLFVTTNAAPGVIRGTEVWLDGQKVGLVKGIEFRPPTTNPKERLVLVLDLVDRARQHIRFDSRVQVQSGGSIIGDRVVYVSSGTARTRAVVNGDTIHAGEQTDVAQASSEFVSATHQFSQIIGNLKVLNAELTSTKGTLGAFAADQGGSELRRAQSRASRILEQLANRHGTVALTMSGNDEFQRRAARDMAQVDSVLALLASNNHSLGRFRRDSTLPRDIAQLRTELADVQRLAASPTGTIERLRADSAITRNINRNLASLDSLMADIKRHPLRYIAF